MEADQLFVARLGGDEFALLCKCDSAAEALVVAQEAIAVVSAPYRVQRREMRISACAGVSYQADDNVIEAVRRADIALYDAKASRGRASLFSEHMEGSVRRRTAIEQALREPHLTSDVKLSFQPIFSLDSMQLQSFEALARWKHPQLGWVSPSEFIPITEQINVVQELSGALLTRAAAAARTWPETVRLSFNLSPVHLCAPTTAASVLNLLARCPLDPCRLQVEVTETALLSDFNMARANLAQLRRAGIRIVLDDFGAGYSSISYLREIAFDAVKLDGSLISPIRRLETGAPLLRGVIALCRAMGQECVAEHIETDVQLQALRALGCEYGQGFYLSPPVSEEEAGTMAGTACEQLRRSGTR